MRGLKGMRVVVTGAGGGIGAAVVDRLLDEEADVVGLDVQLPEQIGLARALACDVTSEEQVKSAIRTAESALGGIDGLVTAAGIQGSSPTHELDIGTFQRVLDVSALGTFLLVRAVLPGMLDREGGRIVTFGSTAAVCGAPGLAAYAAAKGAVLQFTRSVAAEYAARGVRANCLCPGGTMTPLMQQLDEQRNEPDNFRAGHPIGRYAEPAEIAGAASYLLSDDASFVVGTAFLADGGFAAT